MTPQVPGEAESRESCPSPRRWPGSLLVAIFATNFCVCWQHSPLPHPIPINPIRIRYFLTSNTTMRVALIPQRHLSASLTRIPRPARFVIASRAYRRSITTSTTNKRLNSSLAIEPGSTVQQEASEAILHGRQLNSKAPERSTYSIAI